MPSLVHWEHTHKPGFKVEAYIAGLYGLKKNERVRDTDLYDAESGRHVEIKSISSYKIAYVLGADGVHHPKFRHFQLTRKALQKNECLPVLRPGGCFRTNINTPGALFVVHPQSSPSAPRAVRDQL